MLACQFLSSHASTLICRGNILIQNNDNFMLPNNRDIQFHMNSVITMIRFPFFIFWIFKVCCWSYAYVSRLETMDIKKLGCQVKVIGTVVTLGGTILMASYKGHVIGSAVKQDPHENVNDPTGTHWIMGSFFVFVACAAFSAFYIVQVSFFFFFFKHKFEFYFSHNQN